MFSCTWSDAQQVFSSREAIAGEQQRLNGLGFTGADGEELREDGYLDLSTLAAYQQMRGQRDPFSGRGQIDVFLENVVRQDSQEGVEAQGKARDELNRVIDQQYPWSATVIDPWVSMNTNRPFNGINASYELIAGAPGVIADMRMDNALKKIQRNRDSILEASEQFNIPPEVIASIILKEQYTQSIPDRVGNFTSAIGNQFPVLANSEYKVVRKIFGDHSTGFGAIFPNTARDAWKGVSASGHSGIDLPSDNLSLQKMLSTDDHFNIMTIGAVLANEAMETGIADSIDALANLSYEDWQVVLAAYNGSGDQAEKYSRYVYQYLPYMKDYLGVD